MSGGNQNWRTPDDLFKVLDAEVGGFDIDVAADEHNTKCKNWNDVMFDSFKTEWFGNMYRKAWCNPPYAKPLDWVNRAIEEVNNSPGAVVYMLLNHDASTKWYAECVKHASEIRIMTHRRVGFIPPDGVKTRKQGNPKAQMIAVFRKKQPSAPCHVWHWNWKKDMEEDE